MRKDTFHWNIAKDITGTATPNILSELSWNDVKLLTLSTTSEQYHDSRLYVQTEFLYGYVFSGKNQDSDYNGDNRTLEFSRSNNNADEGQSLSLSLALGYILGEVPRSGYSGFSIVPMVGYGYHANDLILTDGFQTIPVTGAFAGLNSTYDSVWRGFFGGVKLVYATGKPSRFFASYKYYDAEYDAEANWNLRADFQHPVSFKHEADGTGKVIKVGGMFRFSKDYTVALTLKHEDWRTDPGLSRTFFANGSITTIRLNEVELKSRAITVSLLYPF